MTSYAVPPMTGDAAIVRVYAPPSSKLAVTVTSWLGMVKAVVAELALVNDPAGADEYNEKAHVVKDKRAELEEALKKIEDQLNK